MRVIGVTGSIGMGKSTTAQQLSALGFPLFSADKAVHVLLEKNAAVIDAVAQQFPDAVENGRVSRPKLGSCVFEDVAATLVLEAILHPRVREMEEDFIFRQQVLGAKLCVLDIPLLFETGAECLCDAVLVATAPFFLQRQRVLARPNMSAARFDQVLARQWPDALKRALADASIHTGLGKAHSMRQIKTVLQQVLNGEMSDA